MWESPIAPGTDSFPPLALLGYFPGLFPESQWPMDPSKEIASPLFGQEGNVRQRVRRSRRDKAIGRAFSL